VKGQTFFFQRRDKASSLAFRDIESLSDFGLREGVTAAQKHAQAVDRAGGHGRGKNC